jgi:hypothetical protein
MWFLRKPSEPSSESSIMSLPNLQQLSKTRRDSACSVSDLHIEAATAVLMLPSVPLSFAQPLDITEPTQAQEVIDACRHLLRLSELSKEEKVNQYLQIYSLVAQCMLLDKERASEVSRKIAELLYQADNLELPSESSLLVIIIGNVKGVMRGYL